MIVEVCANSLESATNAQNAGADRIELCVELGVGGVTPSWGLLNSIKQVLSIPIHVLIRPRSGHFTYSDTEFRVMGEDISLCVEMGFEGVVAGVLNADFTVDVPRTGRLVSLAKGRVFTFHRAFDWVPDPFAALEVLEGLGVDNILSSGQRATALQGLPLLSHLRETASRCHILPGGGIGPQNVLEFKENGFKAVHLSAARFGEKLPEPPKVSMNTPSFLREDAVAVSQGDIIGEVCRLVK